jgi:hypothetical protein
MRRRILVTMLAGAAMARVAAAEPPLPDGVLATLLKTAAGNGAGVVAKTYTAETLRPERLQACLILGRDIDAAAPALDRRLTALHTEDAALATLRAAPGPVDAYNARVHRQREDLQAYDRDVAPQHARLERFNETCARRWYFQDELAAIRPLLPFEVGGK